MSMDDFIPPGFVPMANWDFRERQKQDGHSVQWKTLSDAVKNGELPGFKLSNGRWFVHERLSNEYLASALGKTSSSPAASRNTPSDQTEAAVVALCEINNGISLMLPVLERIATAVESIATQPKAEAAGTWRDMNGESL